MKDWWRFLKRILRSKNGEISTKNERRVKRASR